MGPHLKKILITGWRGLPHSYAVLAQFICLELLGRGDVALYFEDAPLHNPEWKPARGMFAVEEETAIGAIPNLPVDVQPDLELRISFPYDFATPPRARRTLVFATSEYKCVPVSNIRDRVPLEAAIRMHGDGIYVLTSSQWSRDGFVRSGAPPERVHVVPLGFDPELFRVAGTAEREKFKEAYSIDADEFVFLNIGAMTGNKNPGMLLRGFAAVLRSSPNARLILKGTDALYPSKSMFMSAVLGSLDPDEIALAMPRVRYIGGSLGFTEMAALYHASDCYVSPYVGEGFNMPVLEASACGLPVICTAGGPTDDFTSETFARHIRSSVVETEYEGEQASMLQPDFEHLTELMRGMLTDHKYREQASLAGPDYVASRYTWKQTVDRLLELI